MKIKLRCAACGIVQSVDMSIAEQERDFRHYDDCSFGAAAKAGSPAAWIAANGNPFEVVSMEDVAPN